MDNEKLGIGMWIFAGLFGLFLVYFYGGFFNGAMFTILAAVIAGFILFMADC